MQPIRQNKRKGRQLLVAAVGIASVSYVGTIQGCADTGPEEQQGEDALVADQDPEELGESAQSLNATLQAVDARALSTQSALYEKIFKYGGLPGSGNLMPTPGGTDPGGIPGGRVIIDVPIPVGNLMVTPVDQVAIDEAAIKALEAAVEQR